MAFIQVPCDGTRLQSVPKNKAPTSSHPLACSNSGGSEERCSKHNTSSRSLCSCNSGASGLSSSPKAATVVVSESLCLTTTPTSAATIAGKSPTESPMTTVSPPFTRDPAVRTRSCSALSPSVRNFSGKTSIRCGQASSKICEAER